MLGTFHALKQNHTWAISQVVNAAYIFRSASTVRWGGNLCYFWCVIIGPAEPVFTRFPCIKILGFRMQIVPRWRTVKKEAILGPVSGLKLHMGKARGLPVPVTALAQLGSERKLWTSWFLLPEAHTGLSPLCTSFWFVQFLGNGQISHLFWEDLFLHTKT